jgi:hypothetical protein
MGGQQQDYLHRHQADICSGVGVHPQHGKEGAAIGGIHCCAPLGWFQMA